MRFALHWLALSWLLVGAPSARAQEPGARKSAPPPAYAVSARMGGGVGLGRPALSGRVGVSGEYWFSRTMGVGMTAALLRQSAIFGDESASEGVGVLAALRSADNGHHFYFGLGLGYARVKHTDSALCLGEPAMCGDRVLHYNGLYVSSALGWLAHMSDGALEIGPMLRLDLLVDPQARVTADYAVSFGGELGFAL